MRASVNMPRNSTQEFSSLEVKDARPLVHFRAEGLMRVCIMQIKGRPTSVGEGGFSLVMRSRRVFIKWLLLGVQRVGHAMSFRM